MHCYWKSFTLPLTLPKTLFWSFCKVLIGPRCTQVLSRKWYIPIHHFLVYLWMLSTFQSPPCKISSPVQVLHPTRERKDSIWQLGNICYCWCKLMISLLTDHFSCETNQTGYRGWKIHYFPFHLFTVLTFIKTFQHTGQKSLLLHQRYVLTPWTLLL